MPDFDHFCTKSLNFFQFHSFQVFRQSGHFWIFSFFTSSKISFAWQSTGFHYILYELKSKKFLNKFNSISFIEFRCHDQFFCKFKDRRKIFAPFWKIFTFGAKLEKFSRHFGKKFTFGENFGFGSAAGPNCLTKFWDHNLSFTLFNGEIQIK